MKTILILILVSSFILEQWLSWLNSGSWKNKVPDELSGIYNDEEYSRARKYEQAKRKLSVFVSTVTLLLMIGLISSGSFALLDRWTRTLSNDLVIQTVVFFGVLALLADIISMPVSLYRNFVIEENFGFNRLTTKTWVKDKLRGYILGGLLGGSLLAMFVLFYQIAGNDFWWITWMVFTFVSVFFAMFYTSLILPLYNKLVPLENGELRKRILNYCKKVNFPVQDICVMDGSKRSSRANAFFSGLGPKRRIVLFDTLISNHTVEELVAVVAHEIGHYKKKHIPVSLLLATLQTGLMLFILSRFIESPLLSSAMGSSHVSFALGLLGFTMLYSPVSMVLGLLMNAFSRKNEYEADAYAASTFAALPLADALKKLSRDHLSNLQPHPLYVTVYYSHPALLQRLKALQTLTH